MNLGQQTLFLISGIGAVNAIAAGTYLLFSWKKKGGLPAIFLGLLLLAFGIRVAKSVFLFFNPQLCRLYLQIGLSACFFIGPALYHFFCATFSNITRMPASWKWSWGLQLAAVVVTGIIFPYRATPDIWNQYLVWIIYGQWALYVAATMVLVAIHRQRLHWGTGPGRFLLVLFASSVLVFTAYMLSLLRVAPGFYIISPLSFSVLFYVTLAFSRHRFAVTSVAKAEKKKIGDPDAQRWLQQLERVMGEQQLYKDPALSLATLAARINISAHQLSQLLNDNLGKSFATYTNEYRVREACRLIATNDRLTFEAIGYEVGYNSKSTFYAAFKKVTDTTPALYKESSVVGRR
ncbi:helix-turn-helix domain-containing protein [Chitinophaga horti]|uniref:Helix-turn-helix domain-containing protein n=1 Tax=Chitinophaga horti TaxID=2920382 RepID=A0ABY6J0U2_9BACT|nr:helix-turn-helix domain-containing protein [Chitinophaga horti]UYQ91991.1 helix-turn-helix domain-containing protein [Chitinophaga horti]